MSQSVTSSLPPAAAATHRPSSLGGAALLAASVLCYGLGVGGLGALILAMAGLVPLGLLAVTAPGSAAAVAIDLALILVFGVQHSVMARPAYKRWSNRHLHPALERSAYVLASGLALLLLVAGWQPLDGAMVWSLDGAAAIAGWVAFVFGWGYLFAATFAINHFDLFGLRQAWFGARGRAYEPVPFVEHWMYRYSRHPLMLGALIGLWTAPSMSCDQATVATGMTLYLAVGLWFEERDLVRQWGRHYQAYRARVGTFFTLPGR